MEVHRFKTREAEPWFAALAKTMLPDALAADDRPLAAPRLGRVRMYTFGAPRVGNSEFARFFDGLGMEAFRIVNGADIVARMPRHANSAGALLDYEHVGRTVLVEEDPSKLHKGFWVEGETAVEQCPLREVSPLSNPFSAGSVLGDLSQLTVGALDKLGQKRLVSPLPCLGRLAYPRPCGILCVRHPLLVCMHVDLACRCSPNSGRTQSRTGNSWHRPWQAPLLSSNAPAWGFQNGWRRRVRWMP